MRIATLITGLGITAVALSGCGGTTTTSEKSVEKTTVTETVSASATATSPAPSAAPSTAASASAADLPQPPAGASPQEARTDDGVQFARYSITGQAPQQVVDYYTGIWQGEGYTITNSGGGGGGTGNTVAPVPVPPGRSRGPSWRSTPAARPRGRLTSRSAPAPMKTPSASAARTTPTTTTATDRLGTQPPAVNCRRAAARLGSNRPESVLANACSSAIISRVQNALRCPAIRSAARSGGSAQLLRAICWPIRIRVSMGTATGWPPLRSRRFPPRGPDREAAGRPPRPSPCTPGS